MQHPTEILDRETINSIRQYSSEIESVRGIPDTLLQEIVANKWFQLLVPKQCNGLEEPLPKVVRIFEALAFADGNVGWIVNLGAGANMFAGYFDPNVAQSIFSSPRTCCAGSGAKTAKAVKTDGGYKVTGTWKYASGAKHATHYTGNAVLCDEEGNRQEDGAFRSFIFDKDQVKNHDDWNSIGLKGTSSSSIEVENAFVSDRHVFSLTEPSEYAQGPDFKFPFAQMAVVNMTSMITGMALHFEELYKALAESKRPLQGSQPKLSENSAAENYYLSLSEPFHEKRKEMFDQLDKVWESYEKGDEATAEDLDELCARAKAASQASRRLITDLYPLFGMNILDPGCEANRVWRDASTATQHYLLSPI